MITQARLQELLHYDPDTGVFTWAADRGGRFAGAKAGRLNREDYREIMIGGRHYLAHRLAWLYVYGLWPVDQIDHINGARGDNRICNLREATHAQNMQNRALYISNTSGFPGVYFHMHRRKWHSQIRFDGKRKHLGYFDYPEDAYDAYLAAKAVLHPFNPGVRA